MNHRADDYLKVKGVRTLLRVPDESTYSGGLARSLGVERKVTPNVKAKEKPRTGD
jgi:hypothetical protein